MARAIAVLGTASDVGKSLITAGLCRLFAEAGLDVAPFKAQNMANQAGVTPDGLEMPRAQILQALACGLEPPVDMGPVLLKPVSPTGAQVVVLGRAQGESLARDYFRDTSALAAVAESALDRLSARHATLVMEGAGSPVELNLMDRDFVNLRPARRLGAALILVADIHRGGVFAQVQGTLDLLPPEDRARVLGIVVNQFKGDPDLFEDGIALMEQRSGLPVLALVPYLEHGLDEEDRPAKIPIDDPGPAGRLRVGALLSPRVSNTEDLSPLLAEPDMHLTWLTDPGLVEGMDLLILPGSKGTVGDLVHHTASGMVDAVLAAHAAGTWVLGICGGYQMLGHGLDDRAGTEGGPARWEGLGLLPVDTRFESGKLTERLACTSRWPEAGHPLTGYGIHHGRTEAQAAGEPLALEGGPELGWRHQRAVGSYLHGLLASDGWRSAFLNEVRRERGHAPRPPCESEPQTVRLRRWAAHLRASLRPGAWERLLGAVRP